MVRAMKINPAKSALDTSGGILNPNNPEWIRVSEACVYARVSKPVVYQWMNRGLLKNVSLRERGQLKGARLISFDSLKNFLESRATGGDKA